MRVMVTATMMVMSRGRLSQVQNVGELAAGRGVRKVRRELIELVGHGRIAVGLGGLGGGLQVGGDLLCNLLVLGRIRLLQLSPCHDEIV